MSWVDMTPDEARRKMIAAMRLDAEEGEEGEEEERPQEQPKGGYGNTRLPYGLCKRFGIDLPEGATPREAWAALEKGTGYSHDEVMDIVKKAGNTKDVQARKRGEGETPNGGESEVASESSKGEVANEAKSLRGMGAKEHEHFKTMYDAQDYLGKELGVSVNYMGAVGLTAEKANKFNDAILTVADELGVKPDAVGQSRSKSGYMEVTWSGWGKSMGPVKLNICNTRFDDREADPEKWQESLQDEMIYLTDLIEDCEKKGKTAEANKHWKQLKEDQKSVNYRAWRVAKPGADMESEAFHEMGHVLTRKVEKMGKGISLITADAYRQATKMNEDGSKDIYKISKYANTNQDEFFAECFAGYMMGMDMPDYCDKMVEDMIDAFKKGEEG